MNNENGHGVKESERITAMNHLNWLEAIKEEVED
jgi:hypothetical protein